MDKTGRNDPCPCGSGKKHKRCCLALNASVVVLLRGSDGSSPAAAGEDPWDPSD